MESAENTEVQAEEKTEVAEPETAEETPEEKSEVAESEKSAEEPEVKTEVAEPETAEEVTEEKSEVTEPETAEKEPEVKTEVEEPETAEETPEEKSEVAEPETAEEVTEEILELAINPELDIEADIVPAVNFALQHNGVKTIKSIVIKNNSDVKYANAELRITSDSDFSIPYHEYIEYIPEKSNFEIRNIDLKLNGNVLAGLTERITGNLNIELICDSKIVFAKQNEMTVLAYDEWHGFLVYPELLSAFVTPNHPAITKIVSKGAEILEKWTDDPSFTGYQRQDPDSVLKQAAAVYGAIQEQNIVYSVPPASFEKVGQRIRLCDSVLENKMGTCIDMTLLYASALEAVGLNPILIIKPGHIFAGVWLEEQTFPESVQDDPSLLSKKLAEGVNEMAVVECTAMNAKKSMSFDEASAAAVKEVPEAVCIIDVKRSRCSGIRPIPARIKTENGWEIERPELDENELTAAPKNLSDTVGTDETEETPATRKQQWERKLLDLGLRNALINFRMSKTTVPLMISSIDDLEDALADGEDFSVLPCPEDISVPKTVTFDNIHELGETAPLIQSEFKNHRLRSVFNESKLNAAVKELYRASKTSIEENGANTLYIALGLLRWYENPKSARARYAPVLLLPIEIVRKSAAKGYVIRLRDDEAVMNITILEKLKQDFDISISGLDPLPLDEHGIDTRKVFTIIRKAVMDRKNWDVLESAYLGIFSFSQFVMWNDIRNRSEELEKNKIVKSLMEGRMTWDAPEMELGKRVSEDNVLLPLPADASQLYAIEAASRGESFVLHGPPGTGKSQTITALIANALAQGKTVLFVAEKMAALEVVQKRLEKIGIGDFCLELHSNKSKKRAVLEQLRKASEVTKHRSSEAYAAKAESIANLRKELDIYEAALHRKHDFGKSLYDLINIYELNSQYDDVASFSEEIIDNMTEEMLEDFEITVQRVIAAAKAVGHPYEHPLTYIGATIYTQHLRMQLPEKLSAYQKAVEEIELPLRNFGIAADLKTETFALSETAVKIAKETALWLNLPKAWAKNENITTYLFGVWEMCEHFNRKRATYERMSQKWKPDFFSLDGHALLLEYRDVNTKWFLAKNLGIKKIFKQLSQYANEPITKEDIEKILTELSDYQVEVQEADRLFGMYGDDLGSLYNGDNTDWTDISKKTEIAKESAAKLEELTGSDDYRIKYCSDKEMKEPVNALLDRWEQLASARKELYGLLDITKPDEAGWIENELKLCSDIKENSDSLKEWISWNDIADDAQAKGLQPVTDAYRCGMAHDKVEGSYKKTIAKQLSMKVIDGSMVLNKFSGPVFDEKIEQFKRMDREFTTLTRKEIYCRLAAKVPNFSREAAQSSELGILQRAIRSGGRGISIRRLLEQLPNMLPRLCPCMLMSPISAAQYLDPNREPFDIVVFDEASQLPTCKAIGALARGKNAVIVGDPKQMPPTSFFANNSVDEDNLDIEDLESILDDCLALSMPQTHLLWHYRSRHESLIAFSNHEFYENKLYTFPSVNDREAKVKLIPVDGVFERGKTRQNRAEAEAVIEELKRRCHDSNESKYSVGVVTFNINQQNLIDDLLTEACKEDPELEEWAYHSDEPIFIKNLENVQGDERDVILFSVGYGPDSEGRVSMNFGPLNREGGWRRLNVAVSRARCEMTVYSSLTPDMINLSRTSAEGVASLKAFLEYASGKEMSHDRNTVRSDINNRSGVADCICRALEENGYKAERMVGHSEYRVDVGVIDPNDPEKYILGILLDGGSYRAAKTTRDRELAQIDVLKSLGWNIIRIWSMDWWDNSNKEINRILDTVERLKESAKPEEEETVTDGALDFSDSDDEVKEPEIPTYEATALELTKASVDILLTPRFKDMNRRRLKSVIENEAPITEELLARRVSKSFGIPRMTEKLQKIMSDMIALLTTPKIKQGDTLIYWSDKVKPSVYKHFRKNGEGDNYRDANDVPYMEAANAVIYILYDEASIAKSDLIKEGAKLMNYTARGIILDVFEGAIEFLVKQELLTIDENDICSLTRAGMERAEFNRTAD
ncbi:MAG: DUF3320 domain-containing protein [Clostridia bacterium]|nr:DUF3320 domain-containing protein [Clostridia bacterium]